MALKTLSGIHCFVSTLKYTGHESKTMDGHAIRKAVKLPPDTKNLLERIGMTRVALPI